MPYPDLDLLRRQAKRLLRQAREGDAQALRHFRRADRPPQLADAHYAVAKVVGFPSWPALVRAVEAAQHEPDRGEVRTRVVLVRSGQGEARTFNQHGGPGLDDKGRTRAARAAERLIELIGADEIAGVVSSRRRRSIETAEEIAAAFGIPTGEPTCDLCEMHPGAAEGLTQEEMEVRYGPNYAFVPGAESWSDFVPRAADALARIAPAHPGRAIVGVTESAVVKASFIVFGQMQPPAAEVIRTDPGSITEWSCLVRGDVRRVGTWRLERYNDTSPPAVRA